jgi:hypothetical protein
MMSDLAFSAYNAWKEFYPELDLLYCVFHLIQIWIYKHLRKWPRPDGISQDDFLSAKGFLIKEILQVMSPKDKFGMTKDEFDERTQRISQVFWALGDERLAALWDEYLKMKEYWSPLRRVEIARSLFGDVEELPMLAVSNNSLER